MTTKVKSKGTCAYLQNMSRFDDVDKLLLELDGEKQYREQIDKENIDMENEIEGMESYLRHLEIVEAAGTAEDNEWRTRYELYKMQDLYLTDWKDQLETELAEMKWKLNSDAYPEVRSLDLGMLTDNELVRLVKHLEKVRNEYYSRVRETNCATVNVTNEFQGFDESRRGLKADLRTAMREMKNDDLLERQKACTPHSKVFEKMFSQSSSQKEPCSAPERKQRRNKEKGKICR